MTTKAEREGAKAHAAEDGRSARTAAAWDRLCKCYGLEWPTLAGAVGGGKAALAADHEVAAAPDGGSLEMVRKAEEILNRLAHVMKKEFIAVWLSRPNDACGGRAPLELLREGAYETVEDVVYSLEAGEPV